MQGAVADAVKPQQISGKRQKKPNCVPLLTDTGHGHGHGHSEHHQHAHGSGCTSEAHTPGKCHGFETSKKGMWTEVHSGVDVQNSLKSKAQTNTESMTALRCSASIVFVVMVAEFLCGYLANSLALMSDASHQLSDVVLYLGLLAALLQSSKTADSSTVYTFGYHRAQVLGAFVALLLQYFIIGLVVAEALRRLNERRDDVDGMLICLMATITLLTNILLLKIMPSNGHSHGAYESSATGVARLHIFGDLCQGLVCIATGAVIWVHPQSAWLDSWNPFFYAAILIRSTMFSFKDFVHILMEHAPPEMNTNELFNDLAVVKGVIDAHCIHVWMLAPEKVAMSAHLHIEDGRHEEVLHEAQILLKHKYGIAHSTLQISEDEDLA